MFGVLSQGLSMKPKASHLWSSVNMNMMLGFAPAPAFINGANPPATAPAPAPFKASRLLNLKPSITNLLVKTQNLQGGALLTAAPLFITQERFADQTGRKMRMKKAAVLSGLLQRKDISMPAAYPYREGLMGRPSSVGIF
jgi:hypothetical protein